MLHWTALSQVPLSLIHSPLRLCCRSYAKSPAAAAPSAAPAAYFSACASSPRPPPLALPACATGGGSVVSSRSSHPSPSSHRAPRAPFASVVIVTRIACSPQSTHSTPPRTSPCTLGRLFATVTATACMLFASGLATPRSWMDARIARPLHGVSPYLILCLTPLSWEKPQGAPRARRYRRACRGGSKWPAELRSRSSQQPATAAPALPPASEAR